MLQDATHTSPVERLESGTSVDHALPPFVDSDDLVTSVQSASRDGADGSVHSRRVTAACYYSDSHVDLHDLYTRIRVGD